MAIVIDKYKTIFFIAILFAQIGHFILILFRIYCFAVRPPYIVWISINQVSENGLKSKHRRIYLKFIWNSFEIHLKFIWN